MAARLLISLLGLCATAGFVTSQTCPQDWQYFQDACYGYGENSVTWEEAQAVCKTSNGKLAEIETTEENAFLKSIMNDKQAEFTWIGGTDMFHEGHWVWASTNQPVDQFVDWAPSEPNDSKGQDCMRLDKYFSYQWDDFQCDDTFTFLCESLPQEVIVG